MAKWSTALRRSRPLYKLLCRLVHSYGVIVASRPSAGALRNNISAIGLCMVPPNFKGSRYCSKQVLSIGLQFFGDVKPHVRHLKMFGSAALCGEVMRGDVRPGRFTAAALACQTAS